MQNSILNRRGFLKTGALFGTSLSFAIGGGTMTWAPPVHAAVDKKKTQVPGFYRFMLGEFEVTVLSDGAYELPTGLMAFNQSRETVTKFLKDHLLSTEFRLSHVNIPLINTGKDLVLVDVGGGPNWMESAGKLVENMKASGYKPEDVTKVVVTHGHPDHIWGMYDEFEEAPTFPNATYYIASDEWDFWTTDKAMATLPEMFQGFAVGAKKHLPPIADKTKRIKPGAEIVPGIVTIGTPGHTVGHMSLAVNSGSSTLLVTADTLTHPYVAFEQPGWWSRTDTDPKMAEASRRSMLEMAVADKALILGYHLSFPGLGRVVKAGSAYRYMPETWQWAL